MNIKFRPVLYFLALLVFNIKCSTKREKVNHLDILWYQKPASRWEEALPLGNGRLGAMVYGGMYQELIQLNEETVWSGGPGNNINVDFKTILPEVRRLIFEGKFQEAQEYANKYFPRSSGPDNNYGMRYQPVGDLHIEFSGLGEIKEYKRQLDIGNAISTTIVKSDGVTYTREIFASFSDDVIIMRLSSDKPNSISCNVSIATPHKLVKIKGNNNQLKLNGVSGDYENKEGKVQFTTLIRPVLDGGIIDVNDSALVIKRANSVALYVSIATNFINYHDISGNSDLKAQQILSKALEHPIEEAKASHTKKYALLYDRVKLNLGVTDSVRNPTDVRLARFNEGNDPQFVSLYFQYGRYLLISSSQPGSQPANLQGIWNNKVKPPWDCKYTVNINTEMNYWPAETTNLTELTEPLFAMIKDISETGKESASRLYGARGWNIHHNTDIWRISGPVDGAYYGLWPMGGTWLSQHLWQHYLYQGDKKFLREVYPILKNQALFYVDIMQKEPVHGWMVVCPSMSPENSHHPNTTIAAGTTMDNQLVFDVFNDVIRACEILDTNRAFADTLSQLLGQMPPMQIGRWGQLQEWMYDWDHKDDKHRHVSHLYGLYPSNQISPYRDPRLFEAAKTSLIARGDISTGWSMGWKVNLWARLLDGDHAYKLIKDQLTPSIQKDNSEKGGTYPNLFDAHPPFQIDGNFGCTAGIAEMLLQSQDRAIHVLPALPVEWKNGEISGLVARGGFEVDLKWKNGEIAEVKVHSNLGGNCRIRSYVPLKGKGLVEAKGENTNPYYYTANIREPLDHSMEPIKMEPLRKVYEYDLATRKDENVWLYKL